jgi:cobalt-zinc-cadmium efflux system outer membrane protein
MFGRLPVLAALVASAALAACVPSQTAMERSVDRDLEQRLGFSVPTRTSSTDPRVPSAVAGLLEKPLDRDGARRIAIANNRRLYAELDQLGVAAASIAEATVLAPLEVELQHKFALDGDGGETEIDVVQDVLDLVLIPRRRGIARAELAAARARAVAATVELVARVDVAFHALVAAQQELELRHTAFDAADAAAEVATRMHEAGNATDLAMAREQDQREQARIELGRAQVAVEQRREQMNALLGLSGEATRWTVEGRLPELPETPAPVDDLEQSAVAASLELSALRSDAGSAAGRLGLARVQAFVPELGVGVTASKEEEGWKVGPAVSLAIPLFNQQQGPRARARAELRRAQNELTATAVELRAGARATRQRVLEAHAEARHLRDTVLPLRQRILDETLRQYNAMNASTFELLAARRELVDGGRQYIDALRRYWAAVAETEALRRGISADLAGSAPTEARSTRAAADH